METQLRGEEQGVRANLACLGEPISLVCAAKEILAATSRIAQ